jgi:hypothetical protein
MHTDAKQRGLAMPTQMNSPYAFKFVFAIAMIGMIAVVGSVGAGNVEHRIDVSTVTSSADIANLPVLHIEDPM